jgi:hypothetical protein
MKDAILCAAFIFMFLWLEGPRKPVDKGLCDAVMVSAMIVSFYWYFNGVLKEFITEYRIEKAERRKNREIREN